MLSLPYLRPLGLVLAEDYGAREVILDTKHRQPPIQVYRELPDEPATQHCLGGKQQSATFGGFHEYQASPLLISWPERLWAQVRMKEAHGGF